MKKLTFEECPKTKAEFIAKWNSDRIFRARAQFTGFDILFGTNVILPDGKIAVAKVK
jgi:hypothetical protein